MTLHYSAGEANAVSLASLKMSSTRLMAVAQLIGLMVLLAPSVLSVDTTRDPADHDGFDDFEEQWDDAECASQHTESQACQEDSGDDQPQADAAPAPARGRRSVRRPQYCPEAIQQ